MPRLHFTRQTCQRIVEAGSLPRHINRQQLKTNPNRHLPDLTRGGHRLGILLERFTQNDARSAPVVCQVGNRSLSCYSPLSREGDIMPVGLRVLIQWNPVSHHYEIINAECGS